MAPCLRLGGASPKLVNSTLATERFIALAMSSVSSRPAAPTTMPAIIRAGLLQHKAFEPNRQPGEGVVDRDHHRHVRTADWQGHQDAEKEGDAEEDGDPGCEAESTGVAPLQRNEDDPAADRERGKEDQAVENCWPLNRSGLLDDTLRAWPRQ